MVLWRCRARNWASFSYLTRTLICYKYVPLHKRGMLVASFLHQSVQEEEATFSPTCKLQRCLCFRLSGLLCHAQTL